MGEMVMRSVQVTKTGGTFLVISCLLLVFLCYKYSSSFWPSGDQTVDMHHLLAVSAQVAKLGGDRAWSIRKEYSAGMETSVKGKTKEGANELLTRGDMESHRIMRTGLEKTFSGLKLVSEEHDESNAPSANIGPLSGMTDLELTRTAEHVHKKDITIWIDPLDATQEYTENLLHYVTTMVCVAVKGVPTIGVVYRPFVREIAWGYVGHGVSPNVRLWMEDAKSLGKRNGSKIIVSRSHAGDVQKVVQTSLGQDAKVEPAGGAGYKVLRVVNGSVDAYVHTTRIKKWDVCAGDAILSAVNGQMTTLTGKSLDYSNTENPHNNDGLLATLYEHRKFLNVFSTAFKTRKS